MFHLLLETMRIKDWYASFFLIQIDILPLFMEVIEQSNQDSFDKWPTWAVTRIEYVDWSARLGMSCENLQCKWTELAQTTNWMGWCIDPCPHCTGLRADPWLEIKIWKKIEKNIVKTDSFACGGIFTPQRHTYVVLLFCKTGSFTPGKNFTPLVWLRHTDAVSQRWNDYRK